MSQRSRSANDRRDFFLSHAGRDQAWAEWLGWQLEETGYTVELDVWDWAPGHNFVNRMEQALRRADRLIAVWSDAYFQSPFGTAEFQAAFVHYSRDEGRILPVLVERVDVPMLYASLIYVDLVGLDETTAAGRLRDRLTRGRPVSAPPFPHSELASARKPSFAGRSPRVWRVPVRNPHFTGRTAMLLQLRRQLRSGKGTLAVQALHGLGGVGKSQLATEYAHRFAADYDVVWWIDAERPVLIADQVARLAGPLSLPIGRAVPDTVEMVLAELRKRSRWLLIFDNAKQPEDIASYRPDGPGHVLATSRFPGWGVMGGRLEVDVLARSETVALLQQRIPGLGAELADQLAAELGDLPLAAAQGAAYLEQTGLPPTDYLRRFRSRRADLLARGDVLGYHGRLDTAWTLSLERLRLDNPASVQLLQLAAFMAPEPIPLRLFSDHSKVLSEPLRSAAADEDTLADALGAVVGLSLARRQQASFQLHRLVQAAIRNQLSATRQKTATDQVLALLASAHFGDPNDPANWSTYAQLAPHVLATSLSGDDSAGGRQLMLRTVEYLSVRGDSRTSRPVFEDLLDRWRDRLGPEHPDTLALASELTAALAWLGEYEQARALGRDTLENCRGTLGPDHPATLRSAAGLTFALAWLGEHEQATVLGRDTLERCRRTLGPDHPATLRLAAGLVSALTWLGKYEQAREMGEDTLERWRRAFGPDHPDTLRAAAVLTFALAWLGAHEQARALGRDTLERCGRTLGPLDPITLGSAVGLTLALADLGEHGPARDLGQDSLERARQVLGADHPTTLGSAAVLTFVLAWLGEYEAAGALGRDTLERCRRTLAPDHPMALRSASGLTLAITGLGQPEQARLLGLDTLERCRRVLGPDHIDTLGAAASLTLALAELGDHRQACVLGRDTLERCRRALAPDHPVILRLAALLT